MWNAETGDITSSLDSMEACWSSHTHLGLKGLFYIQTLPHESYTCGSGWSHLSTALLWSWWLALSVLVKVWDEARLTCITAQQRLISKVVNKVLKSCKLVKPEHIAVSVSTCHMEMLDWILRPVCEVAHKMDFCNFSLKISFSSIKKSHSHAKISQENDPQ